MCSRCGVLWQKTLSCQSYVWFLVWRGHHMLTLVGLMGLECQRLALGDCGCIVASVQATTGGLSDKVYSWSWLVSVTSATLAWLEWCEGRRSRTVRATAFITFCNGCNVVAGRPARMALQQSDLGSTSAAITLALCVLTKLSMHCTQSAEIKVARLWYSRNMIVDVCSALHWTIHPYLQLQLLAWWYFYWLLQSCCLVESCKDWLLIQTTEVHLICIELESLIRTPVSDVPDRVL